MFTLMDHADKIKGMRVPNPRMSDPERVYPRLSGGVNV
jgi:hypothetical protein